MPGRDSLDDFFPVADHFFPVADHFFLVADHFFLVADHFFLVADHFFLVADHFFLVADDFFLVADHFFLVADHFFLVADHLRPVVDKVEINHGGIAPHETPFRGARPIDMRHALLALAITLIPLAAFSQEIESIAGVRLTFDDADARSLAMGGTGAANPATLAGAPRSFALESRRRTMEARYISDQALNTIGSASTTSGISSARLIVPMQHTTWSLSYDEPMNVEHSTMPALANARLSGLFINRNSKIVAGPSEAYTMMEFLLPATYPLNTVLHLQRLGATGAWTRGSLAIGASLRYEHLHQSTEFVVIPSTDIARRNPYIGLKESIDAEDLTYAVGSTWKVMPSATIAASYQSGGDFAGSRTFLLDPGIVQSIQFRTPASLRAGVSIHVLPQLTFAADAVRVSYSDMMHSRRHISPQGAILRYADVTELHAGAEYRIGVVALRGGWWRDPAHALTLTNGAPPPLQYAAAIVNESENHVTAGVGFGTKTRFDASIDRGTRSTRAAVGVTRTF